MITLGFEEEGGSVNERGKNFAPGQVSHGLTTMKISVVLRARRRSSSAGLLSAQMLRYQCSPETAPVGDMRL
jgi:hypothetical protein